MQDIISKLNTLKSIEPEENWVVETRKKVLSEAPVLGWKVTEVRNKREDETANGFFSGKQTSRDGDLSRLSNKYLYGENAVDRVRTALFSKRMAVSAFALVFVVSGGVFTVEASKSSLPGDPLYIVKITAEDATLAIAPEDKKAEVEMQQVEKRLEEFDKISKNHSDPKQGEKIEMLLGEIEVKTNNSKEYLTKIEDDGVKAKIAKVINVQTKKSAEVLVKANENLPDVVRDEISEKFASVAESNEKVNFESLATRVELMTDEDKEEITAIVKEKVEEKIAEDKENIIEDAGTEEGSDESDSIDQDVIEAETETEEGADDMDNTENNTEESGEVTTAERRGELRDDLDFLNNSDVEEGDVAGDEDCVCEIDTECGCVGVDDEELKEESENKDEGDESDEGGEVEGVSDEVESEETPEYQASDSGV